MNRIFDVGQRSFDQIEDVAVAVKSVGQHQRHIGILHRDRTANELLILHLAWHFDLRNEEPDDQYLWIQLHLPAIRSRQVAAICRKISRANPNGLPYAFSEPSECFDSVTWKFLLGPSKFGLTCATFVLAVFQAAGLPLVNHATWKDRDGDLEVRRGVLEILEKHPNVTPEHVSAVRTEIGCVRYRPEDVAAAAVIYPPPALFDEATSLGNEIVARLSSLHQS